MIVYLDTENRCHTVNDGTMSAVEDSFFDGKCAAYIEGYKLEEPDGLRRIYPVIDSRVLEAYQKQYEADAAELKDADAALSELGGEF